MSDERKPGGLAGFRRSRIDPARMQEFAETARELQRERAEAKDLVERVLKETPAEEWPALAERAELQTSGALEKLGNMVAQVLGRDPRHARAVAELAVSIAEGIPETAYPAPIVAQLQAHAWKDLAKAMLYLGNFAEALAATDHAEARLVRFGSLVHDHAIVGLVRAETLQQVDRFDEALATLEESKRIFRDHRDDRRLLLARTAEGVLLHRLRRYREAREVYLSLLPSTNDSTERDSVACLYNVIGHCSVELGDYDAAESYLTRAALLFNELGHSLQAAKAEFGRGRMFIRSGDVDRGIAHLRPIRSQFLRAGLIEEAGICGLQIVEALLLRDDTSEAVALSRQIIAEFTSASLSKRAISALGYLEEAIAAHRATTTTVAHVRDYILSLQTCPEREFVAAV
jgi:tetratricopeptide (TPR) repeat protein